ncbi:hypothetical protein AeRB84_010823 [Aphanomyces euteiches]|nr:hypothetical protein AeRB84_010823 [Aphanomyces euteiches]
MLHLLKNINKRRDAAATWPEDGPTPAQQKLLRAINTKSNKIAIEVVDPGNAFLTMYYEQVSIFGVWLM